MLAEWVCLGLDRSVQLSTFKETMPLSQAEQMHDIRPFNHPMGDLSIGP